MISPNNQTYILTLVNKLCDLDPAFTAPEGKREMQDVSFNDDLINIKFGFDKKGQPNMVAFNRLSERYLKGEIDSYYIISIDGKDNKVTFFDLYQHLPYTNYNVGTGQVMLKEKPFFDSFNQEKDYSISKVSIIHTLRQMKVQSHNDHITLKEIQLKKSLELFDNTLKQYC